MLDTLSSWADILGLLISISTFLVTHTILKDVKSQRVEYEAERFQLQTDLIALRDNFWEDNQTSLKFRSKTRTCLYTYKQKYLSISSLSCIYHLHRALNILKKNDLSTKHKEKLCVSLDFLIARFNKTEVQPND